MRSRPSLPLALFTAATGLLLLASGPAATARTSGDVAVAVAPGLSVAGHGFGHGHGLSQYGAQGAAMAGRTAAQILAFYYPQTVPAQLSRRVQVQIGADTDGNTIVLPAAGLSVHDLGSGTTYPLPTAAHPTAWRLAVVQGHTRMAYLTDIWRPYRPLGRVALAGDGQFRSSAGVLTLRTPAGDRRYRGFLRLSAGHTINDLSLDNYVKGVVAAEMPSSWRPAALQAQAVAARTYAAWTLTSGSSTLCDSTSCQVYRGYQAETSSTNAAVRATAGEILTYAGKPAFTQFSSSSGGWTAPGNTPYLAGHSDPYDSVASNSSHSWSLVLDVGALQRAYPAIGVLRALRVLSRDGVGDWGGRVNQIQLVGTKASVTITGADFRSRLGLKSTLFTLVPPKSTTA